METRTELHLTRLLVVGDWVCARVVVMVKVKDRLTGTTHVS